MLPPSGIKGITLLCNIKKMYTKYKRILAVTHILYSYTRTPINNTSREIYTYRADARRANVREPREAKESERGEKREISTVCGYIAPAGEENVVLTFAAF